MCWPVLLLQEKNTICVDKKTCNIMRARFMRHSTKHSIIYFHFLTRIQNLQNCAKFAATKINFGL